MTKPEPNFIDIAILLVLIFGTMGIMAVLNKLLDRWEPKRIK